MLGKNKTGLEKLRQRAERSIEHGWDRPRVEEAYNFAVERAKQWESKLNIPYDEILSKWVDRCDMSFVNFFNNSNQPSIVENKIRVFDTVENFKKAVSNLGFRCPKCGGVSTNAFECNSGVITTDIKDKKKRKCNWKSYGLFGTLNKGITVVVKEDLQSVEIFMPIAWEEII